LCTNAAAPDDLRAEAWLAVAEAQEALGNGAAATNAAHAAAATARSASIRRKGGLALGRALLQMGRIEEGAGRLRAEIAADPGAPEAPDAQMRIAGAMLARGMPEQALEQFQHFLETFTNVTGQAEAHRGKGWALSRLNRHAEAATEFGRAQALFADPTNRCQCQLKVADSEFSGGQYEQAASSYRKLVESFPGCEFVPQAMFQAGECMARLEKPAEAERAFGELSERYPKSPLAAEAQLRLAEIKAGQGRFDEAIAAFDRVMGTRSNDVFFARALHGRGMARYGLFQFDGALADFERVLAGFRGTEMGEQAYYMRGMCLYWQGRDEEAAAVWRSFIRAHPDSRWAPEVLFWSAKFEFNRGAHEAAEGLFLSFADKYPASPLADDALLRAATAATRRAEYQRATEMLGRLVKDYPHSDKMAEARFAQADALSQLAKHAAAILVLDEIIARNPDSDLIPAVWGRKGDCNFVLGADDPARYAQSLECYRATVANPKASLDLLLQAEYKIGRCLEKMGRADEALEQYYVNVILRYFADREKGVWHSEAAKVWFARAAFNAAALYEGQKEWRQAVKVLDRIVAAGVDGEEEARARIARIRSEQWWLFR
jgi:TolA-binding protein